MDKVFLKTAYNELEAAMLDGDRHRRNAGNGCANCAGH